MTAVSVIITHFNRLANLKNTLSGLALQTRVPEEVIVVNLGVDLKLSEKYGYELNVVQYPFSWEHIPLASARNFGVAQSSNEQLIFLDVDCVPADNFCELQVRACLKYNALVMGTPKYLLSKTSPRINFEWLKSNSVYHPSRPKVLRSKKEECYELFWSLCFSIPMDAFTKIGGFDEGFVGYGAEDTDFALSAKKAWVPFYLSEAEVYHQQHPIYVPPINHLESIVMNSNYYRRKWGYWPMSDCLDDFSKMGLIDWKPENSFPIEILRLPSESKIENHLVKNAPYR